MPSLSNAMEHKEMPQWHEKDKTIDYLVFSVLMTDIGLISRPCTKSHKSAILTDASPMHLSEDPFLCGKIP